MAERDTFTIDTSRTTMNWAMTIKVSAAQRFVERDINQLPKSLIYSIIHKSNDRMRYTSHMVELAELKQKSLRVPRELATSSTFLLKRLGGIVKDRYSEVFEAADAVPFDYPMLALLAQGACATQSTIADVLRYDRSYLVGLLDDLEGRGLIERRRDVNDRRRHVVSLTKAGTRELDRLREIVAGIDSELLEPLSAGERQTLQALLAKLAAAHDPRYQTD